MPVTIIQPLDLIYSPSTRLRVASSSNTGARPPQTVLPSPHHLQLLFHADNNHRCSFTLDQIKSHPWMMAEVRWTKKKPIRNLSSQVPSTASLATVRSPAPDAGTINEQVFFSFKELISLAQRGILFRGNHCGGQTPQSNLLNKTLD